MPKAGVQRPNDTNANGDRPTSADTSGDRGDKPEQRGDSLRTAALEARGQAPLGGRASRGNYTAVVQGRTP